MSHTIGARDWLVALGLWFGLWGYWRWLEFRETRARRRRKDSVPDCQRTATAQRIRQQNHFAVQSSRPNDVASQPSGETKTP
jgi:hypothetical protein